MTDFYEPQPPDDEGTRPMQPIHRRSMSERRVGRQREPIHDLLNPEDDDIDTDLSLEEEFRPRAAHREVDPLVAYLLIISLGIGISPLDAMVRYTVLWTVMSVLGAVAYLLGGVQRMREARIDDLVWGVTFGFLSSFPLLLVFGSALGTVSSRMFDVEEAPPLVMDTWVFMALAFVLPLCETLFFRGGMQAVRSMFLTTALATLWSAVLFFPHMELEGREAIALIMVIVFGLLNFMYSYVRFRNGLASAWLCQVVSYTMLYFVPRIVF